MHVQGQEICFFRSWLAICVYLLALDLLTIFNSTPFLDKLDAKQTKISRVLFALDALLFHVRTNTSYAPFSLTKYFSILTRSSKLTLRRGQWKYYFRKLTLHGFHKLWKLFTIFERSWLAWPYPCLPIFLVNLVMSLPADVIS